MNSKGPNTDPCGTPPLMFPTSERQFVEQLFDLQLPMQSVPITMDVVSSNLDQGEVYNIM
jgi:hypothetical protein